MKVGEASTTFSPFPFNQNNKLKYSTFLFLFGLVWRSGMDTSSRKVNNFNSSRSASSWVLTFIFDLTTCHVTQHFHFHSILAALMATQKQMPQFTTKRSEQEIQLTLQVPTLEYTASISLCSTFSEWQAFCWMRRQQHLHVGFGNANTTSL